MSLAPHSAEPSVFAGSRAGDARQSELPVLLLVLLAAALAAITLLAQEQALGVSYIEGEQLARHRAVLDGVAPDPWQYRLFSEYVVEAVLSLTSRLRVPHSVAVAFLAIRYAQNFAIFILAAALYRRLGLVPRMQAVGMALLAWGMTHALFNSDLSVNTYFDVIAYLVGGILVIDGRLWSLVPLTLVAAFNRDTAGFVALLPLGVYVARVFEGSRHSNTSASWRALIPPQRVLFPVVAATLVFALVYVGIRAVLGPAPWPWDYRVGPEIARKNLSLSVLLQVSLTLGVIPLLALWQWRDLPELLRGWIILIAPAWAVIHIGSAHINESRVFLVPLALFLIPAALYVRPSLLAEVRITAEQSPIA